MANYRVICKTGHTLYLTDIASVAYVDVTVKSMPYRRQFGFISVDKGPGAGSASTTARTSVYDPSSIPVNIDYTGTPSVQAAIILDDDIAGKATTVDSLSQTVRRYTDTGSKTFDVPIWNFAGESNETEA